MAWVVELSIRAAAEAQGLSRATVYGLIDRGGLPTSG
jgi:hypothetical protein